MSLQAYKVAALMVRALGKVLGLRYLLVGPTLCCPGYGEVHGNVGTGGEGEIAQSY